MTLGQQMTALCKKKDLSQADCGKVLGYSADIIWRDEVKLSIQQALKITDTPEVSLDYLAAKLLLNVTRRHSKRIEETKLRAEGLIQEHVVVYALIRDFKDKQSYS